MYIDPFVCGIMVTLLAEFTASVVYTVVRNKK